MTTSSRCSFASRAAAVVGGLAALAILLTPHRAVAQPSVAEEARTLVREGNELSARQDYRGALRKYQAAHRLVPSFKIEFNIAVTLEQMGYLAQAAQHFDRFLLKGEGQEKGEMLDEIRARLASLRKRVAVLRVTCAVDGAELVVDGVTLGRTPYWQRIYLEPGTHRVRLTKAGHDDFSRTLVVAAGDEQEVSAMLSRVGAPTTRPLVAPG